MKKSYFITALLLVAGVLQIHSAEAAFLNPNPKVSAIPFDSHIEYKVYTLEKPGTLESLMGSEKADLTAVKIIGKINNLDYRAFIGHKKIQYLDFSEAEIVQNKSWQANSFQGSPFQSLKTLKEVILPKNIEVIGDRTFAASGIERLIIPETVTTIKLYGVAWCDNLKEITIPSSVKELENFSFATCKSLKKVVIKEGLTSLKPAFSGCLALTSISLPNSLVEINPRAFNGCAALTELTLPSTITTVGSGFIDKCTSLKRLNVLSPEPPSAETDCFNQDAYQNVELMVPEASLSKYEDHVTWSNFKKITPIKHVDFDGVYNVTEPGTLDAMMGEKKAELVKVKVTGTIDSRDYRVFKTCPKLEYLDLGEAQVVAIKGWNANQLQGDAFKGMKSLKQIVLPKGLEVVTSSCFSGSGLTSISFPESLKQLDIYSFAFCPDLESVELPGSLQKMQNYVFVSSPKLKKVIINEGLTFIGAYAFANCPSLTEIAWPSTMKTISDGVFRKCTGLETLEFPQSVDLIGSGIIDGCTKLVSLTLHSMEPPKVGSETAFPQDILNRVTLFVPKEAKEKYEDHLVWSQFKNLRTIGDNSIMDVEDSYKVYVLNGSINVEMDTPAKLYLYNMSGNLIYSSYVKCEATIPVNPGAYILCVGNKRIKVFV